MHLARRKLGLRRGPVAFTGLAIIAICAGAILIAAGARSHPAPPAPLPTDPFSVNPAALPPMALPPLKPGDRPTATGTRPGTTDQPCTFAVQPAHVVIGAVCIDGPVVPTSREASGALIIPDDVHTVGMWDRGAQLADTNGRLVPTGTTLLAGHVSFIGQGNGTFYNLYRTQVGAVVYVSDRAGTVTRWRAISKSVVLKAALPSWVFAGASSSRRLVLVTCGGPIMHIPGYGNTFEDNVILTAVPA